MFVVVVLVGGSVMLVVAVMVIVMVVVAVMVMVIAVVAPVPIVGWLCDAGGCNDGDCDGGGCGTVAVMVGVHRLPHTHIQTQTNSQRIGEAFFTQPSHGESTDGEVKFKAKCHFKCHATRKAKCHRMA